MRTRTKMRGLCVHTTPQGKNYTSPENRARMALAKLERLAAKYGELTVTGELSVDVQTSPCKYKTIKVWGKEMKVTIEEYNLHCKHLGL